MLEEQTHIAGGSIRLLCHLMSRTESTMLPLGTPLPAFDLPVVQGINLNPEFGEEGLNTFNNHLLNKDPLLIMILCAHCPFVKHIENGLTDLINDYQRRVQFLAVCSNSLITHPQDGPENLVCQSNANNWRFPYLIDSDQTFAKSLKAACTPEFYLFSCTSEEQMILKYRGQFDASRPGNDVLVTGEDLRFSLESVLAGKTVSIDQKPSIGCNIKWHPGQEPSWFG